MDLKKVVSVTNKSAGHVMFTTSFGSRKFSPGQTRHNITIEELLELAQTQGGDVMLANYLYIEDPEIMEKDLEVKVEPEYFLKEEDIPNWMNTCTLDEFKDALDFAPLGTRDLIQKFAIEMPLNDYSKRQAIKEQLGLDVGAAIDAMKPDDEDEVKETKPTQRRATPPVAENTGRRTEVKIEIPKK